MLDTRIAQANALGHAMSTPRRNASGMVSARCTACGAFCYVLASGASGGTADALPCVIVSASAAPELAPASASVAPSLTHASKAACADCASASTIHGSSCRSCAQRDSRPYNVSNAKQSAPQQLRYTEYTTVSTTLDRSYRAHRSRIYSADGTRAWNYTYTTTSIVAIDSAWYTLQRRIYKSIVAPCGMRVSSYDVYTLLPSTNTDHDDIGATRVVYRYLCNCRPLCTARKR